MAAYRTVLVTVLVITLLVGAVLAALAVYDGSALHGAAFERLAGADTSITVTTSSSSAARSAGQSAVVRADQRSTLGAGTATVTAVLWSNSQNLPRGAVPGAGPTDQNQALLAGFGSLAGSATLLHGRWPGAVAADGSVPAAVPEAVAASLRLAVGSTLEVKDSITGGGLRLRIVGVFRPLGARSPYALLNEVPTTGVRPAPPFFTFGPFDVDPAVFAGSVTPDQTSWDIQPSPSVLAGRDPDTVSAQVSALRSALTARTVALGTPQVETTLTDQLAALATARDAARTELIGVALVLFALTIVALIITARPLGAQREPETYLLALRGRSRRQAALANVGEAVTLGAVTMVAAAPAGTVLAVFLGRAGPLGSAAAPNAALPPGAAWLAVLGVALFAAAILIVAAARGFSPSGRLERAGRHSRLAGTARVGVDLAVLAVAGAAYWQLRSLSSGSPAGVLLIVAPALALLACALVCLRLLPLLAGFGDRLAARGRRLGSALAAWQISRRPRHHAGPALLIVLAVAGGTFALGAHATRERSIADQSEYLAGAQVRVEIGGSSFEPAVSRAVAADRSVRTVTPVIQTNGYQGSVLLAVDTRTAPRTVPARPDQLSAPAPALWADLRAGAPKATTVPGHPKSLALTAMLPRGGARRADVALTVEDALDRYTQLTARPLPSDGSPHSLTFPVPSGVDYPLRVAGLSLTYDAPPRRTADEALTVGALRSSAGSAVLPLDQWSERIQSAQLHGAVTSLRAGASTTPVGDAGPAGPPKDAGSGSWSLGFTPGFGLPSSATGAQATLTVAPTAPVPLPALATDSFLSANGLRIGSPTQVTVDGLSFPARIVGSASAFPVISGSNFSGGLVVDADAVQDRLVYRGLAPLTTTAYWLDTTGGAVPAGLPEGGATVTTLAGTRAALAGDPLTELIQQSLIALAVSAGILAIAALWAAVAAARRERAGQEAVLIALGISGRRQALLQAAEILTVAGPAAIAGLAVGFLVARLMLPNLTLTGAATVPVPTAVIVVPWPPALALAAVLVAGPALAAAAAVVAKRADAAARLRTPEVA
jgi:hypothetical protein